MKHYLLALLCLLCCPLLRLSAQSVTTLYYDVQLQPCAPQLASYYRVYAKPIQTDAPNRFRDYYMNGKLRTEGSFISMNPSDLTTTVLDGRVVQYYPSGHIETESFYISGKLSGQTTRYHDNGLVASRANYLLGVLHGMYTEFRDDGSCVQMEYVHGRPLENTCTLTTRQGHSSRFSTLTRQPLVDTPHLRDCQIETVDGQQWHYYTLNGLTVQALCTPVRDYGKYYQICVVVSNNSVCDITLDPSLFRAAMVNKKGDNVAPHLYSADEYLKKVRRKQHWNMALTAVASGLGAASSGYSVTHTQGQYYGISYDSFGTGFTTGTLSSTSIQYNPYAAFQAQMLAAEHINQYSQYQQLKFQERDEGYLRYTTVRPGEMVTGYIHIARKKGRSLSVILTVDGIEYPFQWPLY